MMMQQLNMPEAVAKAAAQAYQQWALNGTVPTSYLRGVLGDPGESVTVTPAHCVDVRDVTSADARREILAYLVASPGSGAVDIASALRLDIDVVLQEIAALRLDGRIQPSA